jgi:RNA polymerase sigma factor (TIGR02999 family)
MSETGEVTALLTAWRQGDQDALERLVPIVYGDLRRIAARYMRGESEGHTLQATVLVHEAYLRLIREQDRTWENRAHFFGVAAQIMRNLLVDHARSACRAKRGGRATQIQLDPASDLAAIDPEDLLALENALERLAQMDARASRIVELRFFVGLTHQEIANVIGSSERTVKREWTTAKAWLRVELRERTKNL